MYVPRFVLLQMIDADDAFFLKVIYCILLINIVRYRMARKDALDPLLTSRWAMLVCLLMGHFFDWLHECLVGQSLF